MRFRTIKLIGCMLLAIGAAGGCGRTPPAATSESSTEQPSLLPVEDSTLDSASDSVGIPVGDSEPIESTAVEPLLEPAEGVGEPSRPPPIASNAHWTTRRVIALHETGPIVIDLSVSIESQSLQLAGQERLARATQEISAQGPSASIQEASAAPVLWESLLEMPLIRSGWLGNLIADEQQRAQLINMVDADGNGAVDESELPRLLTRGLSLASPLLINDIGQAESATPSASPWGIGDVNGDYALDATERERFAQKLSMRDLNADGVIARQEISNASQGVNPVSEMMMNRGRSSFLRKESLLLLDQPEADAAPPASAASTAPEAAKLAAAVLRHYTFLATLERSQWPAWSDAQWQAIDANADQQIDKNELKLLASILPQLQVAVRWPSPEAASGNSGATTTSTTSSATNETMQVDAVTTASVTFYVAEMAPQSHSEVAQLLLGDCSLRIETVDDFSSRNQQQWRRLLQQALTTPALQAFINQRWQLQDNGFELLDSDGDQQLSDGEFARVWRWLSTRQGCRVSADWFLSDAPWFQLADSDGDQRISQREREQLSATMAHWDRDGDDVIPPNEMPLVVTLRLRRSDNRLSPPDGLTQPNQPTVDDDWFSAMDTNRDGSVGRSEFLGDSQAFDDLDANSDGWINRMEGKP